MKQDIDALQQQMAENIGTHSLTMLKQLEIYCKDKEIQLIKQKLKLLQFKRKSGFKFLFDVTKFILLLFLFDHY